MSAIPNLFSRVKLRVKKVSKPRGADKSANEVAAEQVPLGVPIASVAAEPAMEVPAQEADAPRQAEGPVSPPASPRGARREREPSLEVLEVGSSRRCGKKAQVEGSPSSP